MKKLIFSLFMALIAVQAWAVASVNTMFTEGDLAYRVLSTGGDDTYPSVRVIGFSATGEAKTSIQLTIPAYATFNNETYAVKNVDPSAFKGKTSITSVRFMYGVQSIDASAFENCTNMTYANIPSSMLFIYGKAFAGCTKLAKVYYALPDPTGRVINSDAFPSNSGMTLYVPRTNANSVQLYKKVAAFSKFSTVTKSGLACDFTMDTGERVCVTKAPTKTTNGQVTIVGLNKNATNFVDGVLKRTSTSYNVSPYKYTLVSVCDSAFVNNTDLKGVDFTGCSTLTTIGTGAFNGCTALTSVTLNSGLTTIDNEAFAKCTKLASITLPASVKDVSFSFVDGSTSLTSINVEAGSKSYASYNGLLFYSGVRDLVRCPEGKTGQLHDSSFPVTMKTVVRFAFDHCQKITQLALPYGVTVVGQYAFKNCTQMASCIIPSSVNSLSTTAFIGCTGLNS